MPAKRVARPRIRAIPIPISPAWTRKLIALTAAALLANETQKSWVGLTIAVAAEPGSAPPVAWVRKPAALNAPVPANWNTFSSPAHRKPAPRAIRSPAIARALVGRHLIVPSLSAWEPR